MYVHVYVSLVLSWVFKTQHRITRGGCSSLTNEKGMTTKTHQKQQQTNKENNKTHKQQRNTRDCLSLIITVHVQVPKYLKIYPELCGVLYLKELLWMIVTNAFLFCFRTKQCSFQLDRLSYARDITKEGYSDQFVDFGILKLLQLKLT